MKKDVAIYIFMAASLHAAIVIPANDIWTLLIRELLILIFIWLFTVWLRRTNWDR